MKKILIIEDDIEVQDLYKQTFTKENLEVVQAFNGEDGINILKSQKPDMVLLDIMLPGGLNGFDVLEQIKRNENCKNIPVLILTNLDTEEKTAKSIGAVDYIVKSNVSLEQVVHRVKNILSPINTGLS